MGDSKAKDLEGAYNYCYYSFGRANDTNVNGRRYKAFFTMQVRDSQSDCISHAVAVAF